MQLRSWNSLLLFFAGAAVGALVAFTVLQRNERVSTGRETSTFERETGPVVDKSGYQDSNDKKRASTVSESDPNDGASDNNIAAYSVSRPNTPPTYVEILGPSYQSVSMEDLHLTFSQERREKAWASAVEWEIIQYIANNNVSEWAEIEYVECRKRICELAGYLHGQTTHDPREILDGINEATWWHPSRSTHQMSNSSNGMDYFLVIVTGLQLESRTRPPRPVE